MTITVEIDETTLSGNQFSEAIATMGLTQQGEPLVLQGHTFYYFDTDDLHIAEKAINTLLTIKGVMAAYVKSGAQPPF